jgi:hypothetical protein
VNPLGLLAGLAIAIEGLVIIAYAAPIDIEGIGSIMEQTVILGGVQLFILGFLLVIAWLLKDQDLTIRNRKILGRKWIHLIAILLGAVVAVEGIVLVLYAGPTVIEGIGGVLEQTVVLAGAQLFGLGVLASVTWALREEPLLRVKIGKIIAILLGICIAAEGLIIVGLASPSVVEGIGGMLERTMLYAGIQLLVLGLLVVFAWVLKDRGLLVRKVIAWNSVMDLLIFVLGIVVAVEGLFVMDHAARTVVGSIGGMLGGTIMLGGVQLFALGFLQILMLGFPNIMNQGIQTRVNLLGMLFLILMIPAAFAF